MDNMGLAEAIELVTSGHSLGKMVTLHRGADAGTWAALILVSIALPLNIVVASYTFHCLLKVISLVFQRAIVKNLLISPREEMVQDLRSFATWLSPTSSPACGSSWPPQLNGITGGLTSPFK